MNVYLFVFGELLRAIRAKRLGWFILTTLLVFSFLTLFSCFFLLGRPANSAPLPGEIIIHLSPQLSDQEIDVLYLTLREWEGVQQINYRFNREDPDLGGLFVLLVMPDDIASLIQELRSTDAVLTVERSNHPNTQIQPLSSATRFGLLAGLILNALACLLVARRAFKVLLQTFSAEIRILRLTGIPEKALHYPLIALGLLCGLVASLLFIVAIYVTHLTMVSDPGTLFQTASGLLNAVRIRTVSLLGLLLGLVMGTFAGTLGISLIEPNRLQNTE